MNNLYQDKIQAAIGEMLENDPDFRDGRKLIFYGLAALLGVKVIYAVLEQFFYLARGLSQPVNVFLGIFSLLVIFFFAYMIHHSGSKPFAILALIGGMYSLITVPLPVFGSGDTFFNIISVVLIIVIIVQTGVMLFFIINQKCRHYFTRMADLQKELKQWARDHKR